MKQGIGPFPSFRLFAVLACVAFIGGYPGVAGAQLPLAADGRPISVPAIQHWEPAGEGFALAPATRILVRDASLLPVAETFAEDLRRQHKRPLPVLVIERANAQRGDILLELRPTDLEDAEEAYELSISERITISAVSPHGVFNGTRTLLQWLRQSPELPGGVATDWPRYPERGLMVDVGRKYFTPEWLKDRIRELASIKMNVLHLHFSENIGFRIESEHYPEIVAEQHLTKAEVREIIALAERYFITVVPEIGQPGHMGSALAPFPEYRLTDPLGQKAESQLDLTNPDAVAYGSDLVAEYLELFPGPYWHTGGDEYMPLAEYARYPGLRQAAIEEYGPTATPKDLVHAHLNRIAAQVKAAGRTPRAWNDDLDGAGVVVVDPDIVVEWWTDFSPIGEIVTPGPKELLERGHRILNGGWFPTYYVVGGTGGSGQDVPTRVDMGHAYENWEVHQFAGVFYSPTVTGTVVQKPPETIDPEDPRNLGSILHVWCDGPDAETEAEIAASIAPRLRVIAQKTWRSPLLVQSYGEFLQIIEQTTQDVEQ